MAWRCVPPDMQYVAVRASRDSNRIYMCMHSRMMLSISLRHCDESAWAQTPEKKTRKIRSWRASTKCIFSKYIRAPVRRECL